MGFICILCPKTGQQVFTGIETDRDGFDEMPIVQSTMHCWVCGGQHVWSKRWATFVESTPSAPRLPLGSGVTVDSRLRSR
jgi:hypothetical protein